MKHKKVDENSPPFAMIPMEVMLDKRLTLESMRVLITLFSFRRKNTDLVFPTRETMSKRCNMHPSNISAATTSLVKLGWLKKNGSGGHSMATKYTITVPDLVAEQAMVDSENKVAQSATVDDDKKVAEQATVAQSATVAEQATPPVAEQATRRVAQSATPPLAESATRNKATEKLTENLTENKPPDIATAIAIAKKEPEETALQNACKATWKSYCLAFFNRYGIEPLRNAGVNSMVKQFVQKLPHAEAPLVAAFFVAHNDKFYIQKTHPVSLMAKDAEGLRTQWATGQTMTTSKANQLDKTASNFDAVQQAKAMMATKREREANATTP